MPRRRVFLLAALLWVCAAFTPAGAAPPRRIVAMTLAAAETLVALAPRSRIAGLHKLAGDPAYSNVAEQVRGIPLLGSVPEGVIALAPDLVFVASYSSAAFVKHLRAAGVRVARFSAFAGVEDALANVEKMGRLIGEREKARRLVARARARMRAIRARIPPGARPPRVLPLMKGGWTAGADTSLDAMIRLAGGVNVAAARGVRGARRISAEQAIAWNPDALLIGVNTLSGESMQALVRASAAYSPLREKKIVEIPLPRFSSVSHYLVDGLEDLVRELYR